MISEIRPGSYQRYISLPVLGPILDEFTTWSRQRGYTIYSIRHQLNNARRIDAFLQERRVQQAQNLTHGDFEEAWQHFRSRKNNIGGTIRQIERFLEETRGMEPPQPMPRSPIGSELDRFAGYLRNVRGLQAKTVQGHVRYVQRFLEYIGYDEDAAALGNLTPKMTDAFLIECAKGLNRYSLQNVAGFLRAFLRFQHEQGVLRSPLHTMVDTPRIYQLERLPRSLPWEMVKALLSSIDRSEPHGIRDYTMLFLLAAYGLRSCEIASLTLDDIDWRAGAIRIPQRKTGNQLVLPLTDAAGEVLIEYLKKGRTKLPYRELFLRVRAPYGTLKSSVVAHVFRLRVSLSGLDIPHSSPHCLRHSYAVHLLRQGTNLKAIGDLLGHRSAESTCAYLRLSIEDLRCVALPVPEGPEVRKPVRIVLPDRRSNTGDGKKQSGVQPRTFTSFLAGDIEDYINLKRALGRGFRKEACALHSFDAFLADYHSPSQALTPEMFNGWCTTLRGFSPAVRHESIRAVRFFCLYCRRSNPQSFVPDDSVIPPGRRTFTPYIISEPDIARILSATRFLRPRGRSPLRPQAIRIGILLLYTTGIRRGELLRLELADLNSGEGTLSIRDTKFHKSRIIPLSPSVTTELDAYLALRHEKHIPTDLASPLIWNGRGGPEGKGYSGTGFYSNWAGICAALRIFTSEGKTPRIHDLRHSFAVNTLMRWYQSGEDVGAKLPMLSTFMGHVSIASTHYYLQFVEGLRSEASKRFHERFGVAIASAAADSVQGCTEIQETGGIR
jgi:integrase